MLLLLKFLHPYLLFCNLAAWGLAQNLEGLGLFHYINDFPMRVGNEVIYPLNFSPIHGVNGLSGVLILILLPIALLNIRAGFYLNKWAGWFSLCLWIIPGVMRMLGYVPDLRNFGPDQPDCWLVSHYALRGLMEEKYLQKRLRSYLVRFRLNRCSIFCCRQWFAFV